MQISLHFITFLLILCQPFLLAVDTNTSNSVIFNNDGSVSLEDSCRLTMDKNGVISLAGSRGNYKVELFLWREPNGSWARAKDFINISTSIDKDKKTFSLKGNSIGRENLPPVELTWGYRVTDNNNAEIFIIGDDNLAKEKFRMVRISFSTRSINLINEAIIIDGKEISAKAGDNGKRKADHSTRLYQGGASIIELPLGQDETLELTTLKKMRVEINDRQLATSSEYIDINLHPSVKKNGITSIIKIKLKGSGKKSSANNPYIRNGVDFSAGQLNMPDYTLCKNLVQNPGFEQGFRYWGSLTLGDVKVNAIGDAYRISSENPYEGNKCLKLVTEPGQKPCALAFFNVPVVTDKHYVFSFYARADFDNCKLDISSHSANFGFFPVRKRLALSREWKRYSIPFKSPNRLISIGFTPSPFSPAGSSAYIDAVQLEEGKDSSDYACKSVAARIITSRRGNVIQPFEDPQAVLEIKGLPEIIGNVTLKATNINADVEKKIEYSFTLDKDGVCRIGLPWVGTLDNGAHLISSEISANINGVKFIDRDYHRFVKTDFLLNDFKHKNLFGGGDFISRYGSWERRAEFFQRFGVGSMVSFDVESPGLMNAMASRNIQVFSSILDKSHAVKGLLDNPDKYFDLRENYDKLTDEQLKKIEQICYEKALKNPGVRVWKTINEPGWTLTQDTPETEVKMKKFIATLQAMYSGIKRADKKMVVLSPDPANMYPTSGIKFINKLFNAGANKFFDVVAIHPYRLRPEDPDLDQHTQMFLQMLANHGYKDDVWFTEGIYHQIWDVPSCGLDPYSGCTSDKHRVNSFSYDLTTSELMASAYTMRSWLVTLKHSNRIKNYVDWGFPNRQRSIDFDFVPSTTVFASHTLASLLGNSSFIKDITLGYGARCYLFDDGNNQPVAALWTFLSHLDRSPRKTIRMITGSLPAGTELVSFDGKVMTAESDIKIGPLPLFIRGPEGSSEILCKALQNAIFPDGGIAQLQAGMMLKSRKELNLKLNNLINNKIEGRVEISLNGKKLVSESTTLNSLNSHEYNLPIKILNNKLNPFSIDMSFLKNGAGKEMRYAYDFDAFVINKLQKAPDINADSSSWPAQNVINLPNRFVEFHSKDITIKNKKLQNQIWGGVDDLSAKLCVGWDKENLYLLVEVKDDIHDPENNSNNSWLGDSLQIYFDCWGDARSRKKFGVSSSYDNDDQTFMVWNSDGDKLTVYRDVSPEQQVAFLKIGKVPEVSSKFTRTADGRSIYSMVFPLKEIIPTVLEKGSVIGLAILINDRDHDLRKRALTMTPDNTQPFRKPFLFPLAILGDSAFQQE